jgi:hypothetical protein
MIGGMPRFLIIRTFDVTEDQMPFIGRRSRVLTEEDFPEITWEHSHVVVDDTGLVRTFCIYAAPDEDSVRDHSTRLGRHKVESIDEIVGDVTPADFPAL